MNKVPKQVKGFIWREIKVPDFNTYFPFDSKLTHGRTYCRELLCQIWCEEVKPNVFLYQALCEFYGNLHPRTGWKDTPQRAMDELCELIKNIEDAKSILVGNWR